jgi:ABC-type uncharacterized transport system permease subunit
MVMNLNELHCTVGFKKSMVRATTFSVQVSSLRYLLGVIISVLFRTAIHKVQKDAHEATVTV